MKKALRASLTLLVISAVCGGASAPLALGNGRAAYGTVTGSVRDNKGNPLAGAVISLVREGADEVVRQTRSAADGTFTTRTAPGRYNLHAVAEGFNAALFSAVQVRAADEIVYRFNLEPVGSGRTAPERRNDRDNAKWRLRSAQSRRSIFQIQEGEDEAVRAVLEAEDVAEAEKASIAVDSAEEEGKTESRLQGVVETYAAASANSLAPGYAGINFAVASPVSDRVDFIFSGQTGAGLGAPQRLETTARVRANDRHSISLSMGGTRVPLALGYKEVGDNALGQFSVRAVDEWIVRDGVVVVLGLDYSRFIGAGQSAYSISPRFGVQLDANAGTRVKAAYAPGGNEDRLQSTAAFEGSQIIFRQPVTQPVALIDGRAVMERSHRLEFGVERVLDNSSNVEAAAFFDTTTNRGVGLLSLPLSAFAGGPGAALMSVAHQQGAARGLRVVYTRRFSRIFNASAGYSFGRGQQLSPKGLTKPAELFEGGFFQTAALQIGADLPTNTRVRTLFRFSPEATVFAIDPFAGRLAVYDPSLSIQVTQELPTFGLPVRAEAVIDARNLLDVLTSTDDGETLTTINAARRSVRGGISVRF